MNALTSASRSIAIAIASRSAHAAGLFHTAILFETQAALAAADHAPPVGVGNSMVVDPMGVELASVGEITDIAIAWVSAERIAAVRTINPALAVRRFRVVPR